MCRVLQQFQNNTHPADFVYMRRVAAHPADYNPYVLKVSRHLPSHSCCMKWFMRADGLQFVTVLQQGSIDCWSDITAVVCGRLYHLLLKQTKMSCTL